ncbi:hypothetical protein AN958_00180 [Leucoagaricus sp. SymC.cos]|nr:hypothetical protein AN958_00180 [Leucoagaricus sp. SymC.cos]
MSRRKNSSPPPSIPPISTDFITNLRPMSPLSMNDKTHSRTPSPDLPEMKTDLETPIPAQKKRAMAVLGLGTPEVSAWIKAGMEKPPQNGGANAKDRVKSVGFKDSIEDAIGAPAKDDNHLMVGGNGEQERERSLSLQISPCRALPASSSSQSHTHSHGPSQSWDTSPFRAQHSSAHVPGTPSAKSAHELLRTIVKDVMYDFQQETRAEMMGLHLDLVRMGRGWKQELRSLMEEYVGDLNDLREENRRLREENDRLRRVL